MMHVAQLRLLNSGKHLLKISSTKKESWSKNPNKVGIFTINLLILIEYQFRDTSRSLSLSHDYIIDNLTSCNDNNRIFDCSDQ